jgi:hypothetical protein
MLFVVTPPHPEDSIPPAPQHAHGSGADRLADAAALLDEILDS